MSKDILAMSDEDFLKLNGPEEIQEETQQQETQPSAEEQAAAEQAAQEQAAADKAAADEAERAKAEAEAAAAKEAEASKDTSNGGTVAATEGGEQVADATKPTGEEPPAGQADKGSPGADAKGEAASPGSKATSTDNPPDYEGFYKQIMAPIKANGKTISVQSPQEAIQLMQMGANYTHKMQALAPHRKVLLMLENNGMMDEAELSYAIDLVKKKDPEAIKKLLKDSGIDPLDIDTKVEPAYRAGNHRVSDAEATFVAALEDLQSTPGGGETIQHVNTHWDQASKDVLWKDPGVLQVIHEQRASGVYDRVAAEVDRRKTLGVIPANTPFLAAYKAVGDQMAAAGGLSDLVKAAPTQSAPVVKTPVATTVVKPKPVVTNGEKASAATATRTTPKTAAVKTNPLAMSDEDFMKHMAERQ